MFSKFIAGGIILFLIVAALWYGIIVLVIDTGTKLWENRSEISESVGEGVKDITEGYKKGQE